MGAGDGWLGRYARANGWTNFSSLDLIPPADIVGDIRQWRSLGVELASYDAILAFEVVEHVDCFAECFDILRPGGLLLLSSPVPRMDWACKILERVGLTQRRTSPHDHLISFSRVPFFAPVEIRTKGLVSQWGVFVKPDVPPQDDGAASGAPGDEHHKPVAPADQAPETIPSSRRIEALDTKP